MSKTIIPAGYRITIESWENDADNYKTKLMEGLQKESTMFLVDFAKLFYSQNNWNGPKGHGNMYDPNVSELEAFRKDFEDIVSKHIKENTEACLLQYFYDDENGKFYEDQSDGVMDLAYELGLSGGDFYTRVLSSIKVEYIPTEIVLNDVTEDFV